MASVRVFIQTVPYCDILGIGEPYYGWRIITTAGALVEQSEREWWADDSTALVEGLKALERIRAELSQ